ncbi:MAG: NAD(+)/NADH kinase [Bacteroidales bacterium]|nr:NAD(+)/NADH kinase [Bacteroidales bacterium]
MKSYVFIVNPVSGGKDKSALAGMIARRFGSGSIRYTEYASHAALLAAEADCDVVVAVGGDGTVNEVASALAGTHKALGIIPCGSGDGLALHLGMSRRWSRALEQLQGASVARMDYGLMNGRKFFCTTGVGFDAKVGMDFSKSSHRGLMSYVSLSARDWFSYEPEHYRISVDGQDAWEGKAVMITVGNAAQWGNNAKICGGASVLDGKLDITIVTPFSTFAFPVLISRLMLGKVRGCDNTVCLNGKRIVIKRDSAGPAHFDGEPVNEGRRIEIEIVPSSLNVLIP